MEQNNRFIRVKAKTVFALLRVFSSAHTLASYFADTRGFAIRNKIIQVVFINPSHSFLKDEKFFTCSLSFKQTVRGII